MEVETIRDFRAELRGILISFFLIITVFNAYGFDCQYKSKSVYGRYGIQNQQEKKDYNRYKNNEFLYLPGKTEKFRLRMFPYENSRVKYSLDQIIKNDKKMSIYYSLVNDRKKFDRIVINSSDTVCSLNNLPLVFWSLVETELREAVGKEFSFDGVKNTFRIVDAKFEFFDETSEHKSIVYYVKDILTGKIHRLSDMDYSYSHLSNRLFQQINLATLVSVEKPSDPTMRYGDVEKVVYNSSLAFSFTDNVMKTIIFVDTTSIHIVMQNNYPHAIKVMWHEASYVGIDNFTSSIMHTGVKYIDREKLQTPTTIISGAILLDRIIPTNKAEWDTLSMRWKECSLYSNSSIINNSKTIKLMLPIQVGGIVNEYIFTFRLRGEFLFPGVVRLDENVPYYQYDNELPMLLMEI